MKKRLLPPESMTNIAMRFTVRRGEDNLPKEYLHSINLRP
jgi:hypothetical protein